MTRSESQEIKTAGTLIFSCPRPLERLASQSPPNPNDPAEIQKLMISCVSDRAKLFEQGFAQFVRSGYEPTKLGELRDVVREDLRASGNCETTHILRGFEKREGQPSVTTAQAVRSVEKIYFRKIGGKWLLASPNE
jgi:hypothetical protein